MKRLVAGLCAFAAVAMLTGCEPLLIYNKVLPEFKAPADKALCVVLRPMAFTGNDQVPFSPFLFADIRDRERATARNRAVDTNEEEEVS